MDKCENCAYYYIDYYTYNMPPSCRIIKKAISNINTTNCNNFISKFNSFEEINSLDSFMKHFRDMNE